MYMYTCEHMQVQETNVHMYSSPNTPVSHSSQVGVESTHRVQKQGQQEHSMGKRAIQYVHECTDGRILITRVLVGSYSRIKTTRETQNT